MPLQNYMRGLQPKDPSPFYSPIRAQRDNFANYVQENNNALEADYTPQTDPKYDWAQKAAQLGANTSEMIFQSALNAANNATATANATGQYSGQAPRLGAVLRALGQQESGGNWGAVNPDSGAMGKWQVMPSNITGAHGWDEAALGQSITPEQFMNNHAYQRAIVRKVFGDYMNQYGLRGALSAWYSGDPHKWNNKDSQGNYPSIHEYVMEVLHRLGL